MHYKGYEVSPAAQALTGGLFAANLVIHATSRPSPRAAKLISFACFPVVSKHFSICRSYNKRDRYERA